MDYNVIIGRLLAYRKEYHLRQNDLAMKLHMTQSQYSKVEIGRIKLSFENLSVLHAQGCDIDMLITGEKTGDILPFLEKMILIENVNQFVSRLKICEWALEQWQLEEEDSEDIGDRLLKAYVETDIESTKPFERLRKAYDGITQLEMASLVGVNIKKYRELEKDNIKPDAELLMNIYQNTKCKPSFFLDEKSYYLSLLSEKCKDNPKREEQLKALLSVAAEFM